MNLALLCQQPFGDRVVRLRVDSAARMHPHLPTRHVDNSHYRRAARVRLTECDAARVEGSSAPHAGVVAGSLQGRRFSAVALS